MRDVLDIKTACLLADLVLARGSCIRMVWRMYFSGVAVLEDITGGCVVADPGASNDRPWCRVCGYPLETTTAALRGSHGTCQ